MRAFQLHDFTAPPTLVACDPPVPGRGQVMLRISACGLNFADLLMAKGQYQDTPTPPFTLGMEVCGTVIAHGPDVTMPPIGCRVAVFGGQGGLADQGVFAADRCLPVPGSMDDVTAGGFMVAYGTAHLALSRRARLAARETLVVLGAAGGVGLTAVEIGKQMGARVIAVARGADRLVVAQKAGADHLIDSDADDLTATIRDLGGADVAFDPVGGDGFVAAMRACKPEARILTIGFASGDIPQIPANHLLVKNITVMGFYWGGYLSFAPKALDDSLTELMGWHAAGRLRPHISHVLPLDRAADALDLLRTRRATGKVVVTP